MRVRRFLPVLCVAALVATSCASLQEAAAVVNGEKISQAAFEQEEIRLRDDPNFQGILRQVGDEPRARGVYRRAVLSTRIRQTVIRQAARERGIEVTDSDVQAFLDDLAGQLGGAAAFEDLLRRANLSAEQAHVLARRQVYEEKLREAVTEDLDVPDERIREIYEANRSEFEEVHLLRMTLASREEAAEIVDELEAGADFEELAEERALEGEAEADVDLGFVSVSQLEGAVRGPVQQAEEGDIVGPVQTQTGGFVVFEVVERRVQPLEEASDRIREGLLGRQRQQAFEEWVAERMREADIVVNPKYGEFDPQSLQVVPAPGGLSE